MAEPSHPSRNPSLTQVSADTTDTGVFLQHRFKTLYPNETITVTQARGFNLFRYASEQSDKVMIREMPDVDAIKRIVYFPSMRRRDGDGVLSETLTFAGYNVAFGDAELKVYVATVGADISALVCVETDSSGPKVTLLSSSGI